MRFDVLTIFPQLVREFSECSLVGRARRNGILEVVVHDLREFSRDKHKSVDDEPYGGGGGMVMTALPWLNAVRSLSTDILPPPRRILMSPQGRRLDETLVRHLALYPHLILLCGRYEGVDERVSDLVVDEEVSVGDYVLSGGELPAMVLIEAISRQLPGVVGLSDSVENDSFREGLLDYPHYTRPATVEGLEVPAVLTSGDHAAIREWRQQRAKEATRRKRPDLWQRWLRAQADGTDPTED